MSETLKRPRVGLALGSGSARGFAHIGVIEALEENDIPIDCVCGCSAGAIIGAIYCAGGDIKLFAKLCMALSTRDLLDFTVPKQGLVRGERFEELIKLTTKDYTFSQMKIPFCCVATDIEAGTVKCFQTDKVAPAVRASMSIPGVFEPKTIDGTRYVDGGVLCPIPASFARAMGADVVIAVDVGLHMPRETKVGPSFWEIFLRTQELMGTLVAKCEIDLGEVLIVPDVADIAPYSTVDALTAVDIGYAAAMEKMPEIKRAIKG
jgi:NTE family protein